ncbi:hypothetical protein GE061_002578 [Apolygus lucorum]|uniref:Uncharacterized protein n=1 Tax=Apolygus lucorum TaxID=248454 RepID=A0A6A4JJT3_APOLU|nr:hypothetical protein GE061_002578 [Apolygus lucorum]
MALRAALALCAVLSALQDVHGMQCQMKRAGGEGIIISKIEDLVINCPRPLIDGESKSYCCYSDDYRNFDCCDFSDFLTSPLVVFYCSIVLAIVIAILVIWCVIKFFALILEMCCGIVSFLHRKL